MHSRSLDVCRGLAVAASLAVVGWGAAPLPALAQPAPTGDPAGNNGTVKITPHGEDDSVPQNTPHVSCGFDIEWYGFDEGPDVFSTVEFSAQAPTGDVTISATEPAHAFVGGDPAGGAGQDLDGEATYTLAFAGATDSQHGYHVKVTVHTPGSEGADTKQKVFWVSPCVEEPPGSGSSL